MPPTRTCEDLRTLLLRIDGRGYKAYADCRGSWQLPCGTLRIDHVQPDPYAAPSRIRLQVAASRIELPEALRRDPVRRLALADFLIRAFAGAIKRRCAGRRGGVLGGMVRIDCGGQEVIERSALAIAPDGGAEVRFTVSLPSFGRRVAGGDAVRVLCEELPVVAADSLCCAKLPQDQMHAMVACVEDQHALRAQLAKRGLVAFVADGSILPRLSGIDDGPLPAELAEVFVAPPELRVELEAPNAGQMAGMGIPRGVTLICGGGFHGKSTLLSALERGVYDHVPGDGRHRVVTVPGAVKIRAEDGRSVAGVDISGFIRDLPGGIATTDFSSPDASGSTSQAAAICEAVEAGADCLLMDEDTCATNFMIRDARMQALVRRDREPIIPFLDRVRELYDAHGVSTILVMGGAGDYFEVADTVLVMERWLPRDGTADALRIAAATGCARDRSGLEPLLRPRRRRPIAAGINTRKGRREVKVAVRARDRLVLGDREIDLGSVAQLVDPSQTRAIGWLLAWLKAEAERCPASLATLLDRAERMLDASGLDAVRGRPEPDLARPRRYEFAAALNRLRGARFAQEEQA